MKTKKYWLRGGFIGIGVMLVLYIVDVSYMVPDLIKFSLNVGQFWLLFDVIGRVMLCGGRQCADILGIVHVITSPTSHFLIGAVLGLIYGKIKNRRQVGTIMK